MRISKVRTYIPPPCSRFINNNNSFVIPTTYTQKVVTTRYWWQGRGAVQTIELFHLLMPPLMWDYTRAITEAILYTLPKRIIMSTIRLCVYRFRYFFSNKFIIMALVFSLEKFFSFYLYLHPSCATPVVICHVRTKLTHRYACHRLTVIFMKIFKNFLYTCLEYRKNIDRSSQYDSTEEVARKYNESWVICRVCVLRISFTREKLIFYLLVAFYPITLFSEFMEKLPIEVELGMGFEGVMRRLLGRRKLLYCLVNELIKLMYLSGECTYQMNVLIRVPKVAKKLRSQKLGFL